MIKNRIKFLFVSAVSTFRPLVSCF